MVLRVVFGIADGGGRDRVYDIVGVILVVYGFIEGEICFKLDVIG